MAKKMQINAESRSAAPKLMKPQAGRYNGLVAMELRSVEVDFLDVVKADGAWKDFVGHKVPRLTFLFGEKVEAGEAGIYSYRTTPVPHIANSDEYDWWFDQKEQMIKHIIEAYIGQGNWNPAYDALLDLDIDDEAEMEAKDVLAAYNKFFNGVATVFNGKGKELKCIFKDGSKLIPMWGKLLVSVKGKLIDRGNFAFPGYPGDGVLEKVAEGLAPSISIKVAKGESIIEEAPKASTPAGVLPPTAGGATGGAAVPDWATGAK